MSSTLSQLRTILDTFPPHTPFALPLSLLSYTLSHKHTHYFGDEVINAKDGLDGDVQRSTQQQSVTIYRIQCAYCNRLHLFNDNNDEDNLFSEQGAPKNFAALTQTLMQRLMALFPHESECLSHILMQRLNFSDTTEPESLWFSVSGMLRTGNDPFKCLTYLMRESTPLLHRVMLRNEVESLDEVHHLEEEREDAELVRREFDNVAHGQMEDDEESAAGDEGLRSSAAAELLPATTDAFAVPRLVVPNTTATTTTAHSTTSSLIPPTPIEAHTFLHIVQKLSTLCLASVDTSNFDSFLETLFKQHIESDYFPSKLDAPHRTLLFLISLFGWRELLLPTPAQKQLNILNCHYCETRTRIPLLCGEFSSYGDFKTAQIAELAHQIMENHRWWCPMMRRITLDEKDTSLLGWQQVYNRAQRHVASPTQEFLSPRSSAIHSQLSSNLYYKYVNEALNLINGRVSHIMKHKKRIRDLARKEEIASLRAQEVVEELREERRQIEQTEQELQQDAMEVQEEVPREREVQQVPAVQVQEELAVVAEVPEESAMQDVQEEQTESVPEPSITATEEPAQPTISTATAAHPPHHEAPTITPPEEDVTPLIVETPFYGDVSSDNDSSSAMTHASRRSQFQTIPATPHATPTATPRHNPNLTVDASRVERAPSTPPSDSSTTSSPLSPLPSPTQSKSSNRSLVKKTKTKRLMRPSFKKTGK